MTDAARSVSPSRATSLPVGASSIVDDTDHALSRALVAGDREAFRVLVERETPRVFRACYRVLGRIDEAEEATQETFVQAYRSLGTFRGEGHPAAWLTRIAIREAWRRGADRALRRSLTAALDEAALAIPDGTADPAAAAIRAEEQEQVRTAVRGLPDPYREVIALRYFGDLSLLDICAALDRPEGTVKAQIHRGLLRLRSNMAGETP